MRTKITAALAALVLSATSLAAAQYGGVYVNGEHVTQQEIQAIQQRFRLPTSAAIPAGQYWYDARSGLWGQEGGPVMGQILPGLDLGGPLRADASMGGTGVFINGREIHPMEAMYLYQLFGVVIPGRYWLDASGIGGLEGGPALFNLRAAVAQAGGGSGGGGTGYTRRTPFGSIGGDGICSYYMHPSGASTMTC